MPLEVRVGALPRSRPRIQERLRSLAQDARSDGRGNEGPDHRRRRQERGNRRRIFRRIHEPANHRENRRVRRLAINQSGKRQAVVIIRERDGKSLPAVFRSEGAALSWIKSRIAKGTVVNADEGTAWNDLHSRFEMKRINHEEAYSADGACTNMGQKTNHSASDTDMRFPPFSLKSGIIAGKGYGRDLGNLANHEFSLYGTRTRRTAYDAGIARVPGSVLLCMRALFSRLILRMRCRS